MKKKFMHNKREKICIKSKIRIKPNNKKNVLLDKIRKRKKTSLSAPISERIKKSHKKKLKNARAGQPAIIKNIEGHGKKYKDIKKWKGLLKNYPAFILGNAPSLTQNNLKLLRPYFTIGINRVFYVYDPTILFWQDRELWRSNQNDIIHTKAIKVCRDLSDPKRIFVNFRIKSNDFKFGGGLKYLYGRGNSGALAVQLAVALGCDPIILLGTDCKYGKNRQTDFYGNNKDHKTYTLEMCNVAMEWVKKECPVTIYNCSNIKLWKRMELEEVIKKIKPEKHRREYFNKIFSK